jgi:hypothetical protein
MIFAVGLTAIVYALLYATLSTLLSTFDLAEWIAACVTGFILVLSCIASIRGKIGRLNEIERDSGTSAERPSRLSLPHMGGRLWNANPLGPRSIHSVAIIVRMILTAGASLAIVAFSVAVSVRQKEVQQAGASDGDKPPI